MVEKCGPRIKRPWFTSVAYLKQNGYTYTVNRHDY